MAAMVVNSNTNQPFFSAQYQKWVEKWVVEYLPNTWNVEECGIGDVLQPRSCWSDSRMKFQTLSGKKPMNTTSVILVPEGWQYILLSSLKATKIKLEWCEVDLTGYIIQ